MGNQKLGGKYYMGVENIMWVCEILYWAKI